MAINNINRPPMRTEGLNMTKDKGGGHGDGKGGSEGDKKQSPKESDGQWNKPVTDPPKKK